MKISHVTVGKWKENSYLIENEGLSWLVDPGEDFDVINNVFNKTAYQGILLTHGHFDHIGAAKQFQDAYNIPLYIHSKDMRLISQANLYRKLAGDSAVYGTPKIDFYIDDLKEIPFGNVKISIIHLPGHTEGSVCFIIGNDIISGDLLFSRELGRTDLPGGNKTKLLASIDFLINYYEGYNLYPGHGQSFKLTPELVAEIKEKIK